MAVGINCNPFDSNLIWLSVKFALDRFLINLSLFFVREEVDTFLRSLRFLVFICVFVIFVSCRHDVVMTTREYARGRRCIPRCIPCAFAL